MAESDVLLYNKAADCFDELVFSEPTTNRKGGRAVYIYRSENARQAPRVQLCLDGEPKLRAPFGANSYEDASTSRLNLTFSIENEELLKFFQDFDSFAQKVAFQQCQTWFKKSLSESEIASMYRPCLTPSEKNYAPLVRTKVNMTPPNQVRVWKAQGSQLLDGSPADIQRNAKYMPVISISGFWYLSRLFGITLTCTDLVVFPDKSKVFPFCTSLQPVMDADAADVHEEITPDEDV